MFNLVLVSRLVTQDTLPWQPILGAKSAEIGGTPSFLGLAVHNGWQETLICAKFTRKTCLVLRSDSLNVNVKGGVGL